VDDDDDYGREALLPGGPEGGSGGTIRVPGNP